MKNIVHTLTLAQMRANPRRTLVTLVGVVLSVTMLTAVFAGADSFLNLLYRQAAQDNGTWHGRAFETGEQVVENLSQDDRIDQLGLAASWGVSPLDDSNRWGAALYGVNQSFYQLLRVECLEGNLPSTENELAISQTLAKKTGWKIGDQVSLDLLRVWTPQGVDSAGEMIYRQTSGPGIMGLSDSYMLRSVGEKQFTITAIHPESISALTSGLEEWSLNNSYGLPQGVISANYNSLAMGGLQRFGMLLQILCTGFVLLLCLVCMANIHNSLSTGMELRAREYGILRSVGITPVDFRKMIWLESLFYGIKALCWSLPFGMGVLALEYYAIRRAFQLPFCLPVGSIVLAVVLVMGVCWISGLLTRRSLEEQTITEAIQKKLF